MLPEASDFKWQESWEERGHWPTNYALLRARILVTKTGRGIREFGIGVDPGEQHSATFYNDAQAHFLNSSIDSHCRGFGYIETGRGDGSLLRGLLE